jgi:hypothetical protein
MKWFQLNHPILSPLMFAVPNAGRRTRYERGMLKAEGMKAGVADIILQVPSRHFSSLNIEMKTESRSSRQTESQRDYEEAILAAGGLYVVCRTFEEFVSKVDTYVHDLDIHTINALYSLRQKREERRREAARKAFEARCRKAEAEFHKSAQESLDRFSREFSLPGHSDSNV